MEANEKKAHDIFSSMWMVSASKKPHTHKKLKISKQMFEQIELNSYTFSFFFEHQMNRDETDW